MKNYELMSLLSEAKASEDITINICITLQELSNGEQIDSGLYCLSLNVDDFDCDTGVISTTV